MITNLNADPNQLATFLEVTLKQRERALVKARSDYGPTSGSAKDIAADVALIGRIIDDLRSSEPLPLERVAQNKRAST